MSITETPPVPVKRPPLDFIKRKSAPTVQVRGKLVVALKAIVWEGQELDGAAKLAGLTTHALRIALSRPHVIQFLKRERDVFTAHARAQNVHHAVRIRGGDNAAASMRAVDFIERVSDERTASGPQQSSPGMVIIIGHVEKSLNSPANILELQAGAPPSSGGSARLAPGEADV